MFCCWVSYGDSIYMYLSPQVRMFVNQSWGRGIHGIAKNKTKNDANLWDIGDMLLYKHQTGGYSTNIPLKEHRPCQELGVLRLLCLFRR